jgi:hypothetical protein
VFSSSILPASEESSITRKDGLGKRASAGRPRLRPKKSYKNPLQKATNLRYFFVLAVQNIEDLALLEVSAANAVA